jgi:transposase
VPEDTTRIARVDFSKGNAYISRRDLLSTICDDQRFAQLFATRGRPAEAPWRLALVTVMQFREGLSYRQAAEAVRARFDWKYAQVLELTSSGFGFSVLSGFERGWSRVLEAVVARCAHPRLQGARLSEGER